MKEKKRGAGCGNRTELLLLLGAAMLLWMVLCLNGCGSDSKETDRTSIRIGVSLYRGDDTFINQIRGELEERAKRYEQETGIKVTLDILDAKGSQNIQDDQVERFISLGCDVLCINLVDRTAASVTIDRAMHADVPVVFFNRQPVEEDMDRWDKLYYVGADPMESAVLQGELAAETYQTDPGSLDRNGDGVVRYVLLEGENSHQDSVIRTEWSVQTLRDAGVPVEKLDGGVANWERSQASALMEQWLKKYPGEIELVISNNDDMALGAVDAMDRAAVEGIQVVGIDGTAPALEALKEGKLLGTVSSDKQRYAGAIFEIAASRALDEKPPEELALVDGKYYSCPQYSMRASVKLE